MVKRNLKREMGKQNNGWKLHQKYKWLISEEDTFLWPSWGNLKAAPEREIIAAEDHALQAKYHATILKTEKESKCSLCQKHDKPIDHIISTCQVMAREQ
jgi:hypothetical protein